MHEITHQLNQLPNAIHSELNAHVGHTAGLPPHELIAHYRWVAHHLIAQKRAQYEPLAPHGEIASLITDMLQSGDLGFVAGAPHDPFPRWATHQIITHLQTFTNNLAPVQIRLEQEAHQRAVQAAQQAQQQEEEAARQLAQRQVEKAARLHAQRLAEEAAHELARRQAEEAAQWAARQLAEQQALAAAQALAQQKANEVALQEARVKLKLATAAKVEAESASSTPANRAKPEIVFIPGPAAIAEIDRATLALKHDIDAVVTQYASAIAPYLNAPQTFDATAH